MISLTFTYIYHIPILHLFYTYLLPTITMEDFVHFIFVDENEGGNELEINSVPRRPTVKGTLYPVHLSRKRPWENEYEYAHEHLLTLSPEDDEVSEASCVYRFHYSDDESDEADEDSVWGETETEDDLSCCEDEEEVSEGDSDSEEEEEGEEEEEEEEDDEEWE